jgi:hypothetical protein
MRSGLSVPEAGADGGPQPPRGGSGGSRQLRSANPVVDERPLAEVNRVQLDGDAC